MRGDDFDDAPDPETSEERRRAAGTFALALAESMNLEIGPWMRAEVVFKVAMGEAGGIIVDQLHVSRLCLCDGCSATPEGRSRHGS